MRPSVSLLALLAIGAVPPYATAAEAPAGGPWTSEVRCAAIMERMPEMMDYSVRIVEAAALTTPAVRPQAAALRKTVAENRSALVAGAEVFASSAKEAVAASHAAWVAKAPAADRNLTVDALFEREMKLARANYADIKFDAVDAATVAQLERLKDDMQAHCEA